MYDAAKKILAGLKEFHDDQAKKYVEFPCSPDENKEIDQREFPSRSPECEKLAADIAELLAQRGLIRRDYVEDASDCISQFLQSK